MMWGPENSGHQKPPLGRPRESPRSGPASPTAWGAFLSWASDESTISGRVRPVQAERFIFGSVGIECSASGGAAASRGGRSMG